MRDAEPAIATSERERERERERLGAYVTLHKVARVAAVGGQSALEVDRIAGFEVHQIGAAQRLRREAEARRALVKLDRRQAHTIHGDAAAERRAHHGLLRLDLELPSFANRPVPHLHAVHLLQPAHRAHLLDNAGEHRLCVRRSAQQHRGRDDCGTAALAATPAASGGPGRVREAAAGERSGG